MQHPNIVGFRAAQRLTDGHICLALEHCDLSLYNLIRERTSPDGGCISPARSARAGAVMRPVEIQGVGHAVSIGLAYLHTEHCLLHGDVKSANVLVSRDLARVKICDLGVSLQLAPDLRELLHADAQYEGTEPWRPPETLPRMEGGEAKEEEEQTMRVCDRTDIFAFGLVLWEMLTGDVPHALTLASGDDAYRAVIGTRPPLPPIPSEYGEVMRVFELCTQHEPASRPSATELVTVLAPPPAQSPVSSEALTPPPAASAS